MAQVELKIDRLPEASLDAAAEFHRLWLSAAREALAAGAEALAIVLPQASPGHDDWRRAVARDLARASAPQRVNIVSGGDPPAISAMLAYLRDAPGITGQYLALHDQDT